MTISISGAEARLEGDWTLGTVARNIDELSLSLQQLDTIHDNKLRVDCGLITDADMSGLQLLNVWMMCVSNRGMHPTLVNVPLKMRQDMQQLPFKQYLSAGATG